jgi:DNA gyrase subunit B
MMPLVIKKGNLFIAQPPLYRVKERKNEKYLKNEAELNKLLTNYIVSYHNSKYKKK